MQLGCKLGPGAHLRARACARTTMLRVSSGRLQVLHRLVQARAVGHSQLGSVRRKQGVAVTQALAWGKGWQLCAPSLPSPQRQVLRARNKRRPPINCVVHRLATPSLLSYPAASVNTQLTHTIDGIHLAAHLAGQSAGPRGTLWLGGRAPLHLSK